MFSKNSCLGSYRPWDRHSAILMGGGVAYIAVGLDYIFDDQSESRTEAMFFALNIIPFTGWGVGFVLVGLLAFISARWPNWEKLWGYVALTGWSTAWSSFWFAGAVLTDAKLAYLSAGALWGLLAFLWWGVSGLISPKRLESGAP